MRPFRPILAFAAALLVVSCTGTTPGWTYTPAPSTTPIPSVMPSDVPSGGPSDGGGGLQISALNLQFDKAELSAPADAGFQIVFANNDNGIPHNVQIKDGAGTSLFSGEIFNGVDKRTYDVPALAAGAYPFLCTVHPTMTGTITAS